VQERNGQPSGQPTPAPLAPRPNQILATPATVEQCQADYQAAEDVRRVMDQQATQRR
jgi:hypothetical protein